MATMKCSGCGKEITLVEFDEDADGIEGILARHAPVPDQVWCSTECYNRGTLQ